MANNRPLAIFRFDAGQDIGGGHAVRSLALADTLAKAGWECVLVTNPEAASAVPAIARSRHKHHSLPDTDDDTREIRALSEPDLLVVDHYARGRDFESKLRGWAKRIAVFEDMPGRPHDCDILIDPTPGRSRADYADLVPENCVFCLGPSHAILRAQFPDVRPEALARREVEDVRRVLIAAGSIDTDNVTETALNVVVSQNPDLAIDVVLGPDGAHLETIRSHVQRLPSHVHLHIDVDDMAGLMTRADLAIGAAGSSAFERCALGLPSIAVLVVDNQKDTAKSLTANGAASIIPMGSDDIAARMESMLRDLIGNREHRVDMAKAAAELCDGDGARRTMLRLLRPAAANDASTVTLRLVEAQDEARLLAWQCDPETRRYARNPNPPTPEEHRAWFASRRGDKDCLLSIVECAGNPAGMLRLDRRREGTEVSILTAPDHQRRGIALAALDLARRALPGDLMIAEALPGNSASHALFRNAGYQPQSNNFYHLPPAA